MKGKIVLLLLSVLLVASFAMGLTTCNKGGADGDSGSVPLGKSQETLISSNNDNSTSGGTSTTQDNNGSNFSSQNKPGSGAENLTPSEGLEYTLNTDGSAYAVVGIGTFTGTNLVIPSAYSGKPVTSVGEKAFGSCDSLTSVTIPNSVTSIGENAFSYCRSLTSITIPNSVTSIGDGAFYYCRSLTSITIPNSVTVIGYGAFYYCSKLTSVVIPDSVTSIGGRAFRYCSSLKYNEYDNALYLGNENNPYLWLIEPKDMNTTTCQISDKTKFICDNAFDGCSKLTSVTIPDSVTSIYYEAFHGCSKLTSVTFENINGWSAGDSLLGYKAISSSDLSNASTAATYLGSTYDYYIWKRS